MLSSTRRYTAPSVSIKYTVDDCSPSSGQYGPHNILDDKPDDQRSRWNSTGHGKKWILLKLDTFAVVKTIYFGKFNKVHPCNMREFKVYVGTSKDTLTEVLHGALKNDTTPETFSLKHETRSGVEFATRYVKIVPLSTHTQGYNISVWHISMTGITNEKYINRVRAASEEYRETTVLRHILKHLRQRRLLTPFHSILSRSGLAFEHPLISELHETIVLRGDWSKAESLLESISQARLFDAYLHICQPHAVWKRLRGADADGDVPCARGGHAMCIDSANQMIYMHGGWDGSKSLDDFWVYDVKKDMWHLLSAHTTPERNAPGARSCHKMCFDSKTGCIFLLGRLSDGDAVKGGETRDEGYSACSEFYKYHTRGGDRGRWDYLSFDTESSGGPPLVFDHQMVMDSEHQMMYVFGGRVIDGDWENVKYSGLYSYNVRMNKWKLLQHPEQQDANPTKTIIPPRFGHSMVLEPTTKTLYIFAGQREDNRFLSDMYAYDIETNTATELYSNYTTTGGPDASFTQRAVIDFEAGVKEIYLFCGLTKSPLGTTQIPTAAPTWVYQYQPKPGRWFQILSFPEEEQDREEPQPRCAQQVVYDSMTKTVYMHGGNAGLSSDDHEQAGKDADGDQEMENATGVGEEDKKDKRLDDLWSMTLVRPGRKEVVRKAKYQIRQQQFREMCQDTPAVKALGFLQTEVSAVVNHQDPKEAEEFRLLLTHLLTSNNGLSPVSSPRPRKDTPEYEERWTDSLSVSAIDADILRDRTDPEEEDHGDVVDVEGNKLSGERFKERTDLFESLLKFVSDDAKQPEGSLLDISHYHDVMDVP